MQTFFGYVRVSTARQGEHGVSLQEQRDAIARYAVRNNLIVSEWFEERETAAKRGRPVFTRMLKLLRHGKAAGVVIHKIDRGARNLKDWAELGELSDQGIGIRFTEDSVDLRSRSGRLSADILAVVAADYIRNLRDETRKGFYGRIKQGVFPLPAPIGYRDTGPGKPKECDPVTAPLIRLAFDLYSTGNYTLKTLRDELNRCGLRNRRGRPITITGLSVFLNNPFYLGLIRLKRTGETFPGAHEPIVSKALFDRVHNLLVGKTPIRTLKHDFLFRRLLTCKTCGYSLIGERQKGHVYYRCHNTNCPSGSLREEQIESAVERRLSTLAFTDEERQILLEKSRALTGDWSTQRDEQIQRVKLQLERLKERLTRLTDAYLDGVLEKDLFEQRKAGLLFEQRDAEDRLAGLRSDSEDLPARLSEFLELAGSVYLSYKSAIPSEKRELLRIVTSNRTVDGKNVDVTLAPPFSDVAARQEITNGAPYCDTPRTLDQMVENVSRWLSENPEKRFKLELDLQNVA